MCGSFFRLRLPLEVVGLGGEVMKFDGQGLRQGAGWLTAQTLHRHPIPDQVGQISIFTNFHQTTPFSLSSHNNNTAWTVR